MKHTPELPYAVYTNASTVGISSVLTQEGDSGEILVVPTASRVLTPIEWRYSTCEQELLAVASALKKFWIYMTGHAITVFPPYCIEAILHCTLLEAVIPVAQYINSINIRT
jgi:hypothetical protein